MNLLSISNLTTQELIFLKQDIEAELYDRRSDEAQQIWDNILSYFDKLKNIGANSTLVMESQYEMLGDLCDKLIVNPDWTFDTN